MGQVATKICGGQGPLDWLIKNYGDDIGKFIAIEKVKQFLDTKIADLKNMITGKSGSMLTDIHGQIDGKKTQLTNTFQKYKSEINNVVPGGVNSLERLKGEPIEQTLGLNTFLQKFDELKSTTTTRFNDQKTKAFGFIDQTGEEQKQMLNSQRPKVPLYDDLSANQQKVVFKEGQKVFATQIQQHQDTLVKQLGDKLNPETYLQNFTGIMPSGSLDGILGNATNKFESVKQMLSGGGLSGLAQGLQGIF